MIFLFLFPCLQAIGVLSLHGDGEYPDDPEGMENHHRHDFEYPGPDVPDEIAAEMRRKHHHDHFPDHDPHHYPDEFLHEKHHPFDPLNHHPHDFENHKNPEYDTDMHEKMHESENPPISIPESEENKENHGVSGSGHDNSDKIDNQDASLQKNDENTNNTQESERIDTETKIEPLPTATPLSKFRLFGGLMKNNKNMPTRTKRPPSLARHERRMNRKVVIPSEPVCWFPCHQNATCENGQCICQNKTYGDGFICTTVVPVIKSVFPQQARSHTEITLTLESPVEFQTRAYVKFGSVITSVRGVHDYIATVRVPSMTEREVSLSFSYNSVNWSNEGAKFVYLENGLFNSLSSILRRLVLSVIILFVCLLFGYCIAINNILYPREKKKEDSFEDFFKVSDSQIMNSDEDDVLPLPTRFRPHNE